MQAQACLACPEGGPFLGTAFHALQIQLSINSCPAGGVVREHQKALCMSCAGPAACKGAPYAVAGLSCLAHEANAKWHSGH